MTSKNGHSEAYVWIWLPDETAPVVAGLLTRVGAQQHMLLALRADPSSAEAHNTLGGIYLQRGELEPARRRLGGPSVCSRGWPPRITT